MASEAPRKQPSTPPKLPAIIAAAVLVAMPLTARFEGLRTKPYLDPAGIPTVCYGETELALRVYSVDECGAMLRQRLLKDYAPKVAACVPSLVSEAKANALAAFVDASYNAGPKAVCNSRMAKAVRAGDLRAACDGFAGWYVTARGKRFPGLVRRREAERQLCLKDAEPQLIRVDYQRCTTVSPGPIERPDHYSLPYKRRKDMA